MQDKPSQQASPSAGLQPAQQKVPIFSVPATMHFPFCGLAVAELNRQMATAAINNILECILVEKNVETRLES